MFWLYRNVRSWRRKHIDSKCKEVGKEQEQEEEDKKGGEEGKEADDESAGKKGTLTWHMQQHIQDVNSGKVSQAFWVLLLLRYL